MQYDNQVSAQVQRSLLSEFVDRFEKAVSTHWNNKNELYSIKQSLQSTPSTVEEKNSNVPDGYNDFVGQITKLINEFELINHRVAEDLIDMRRII